MHSQIIQRILRLNKLRINYEDGTLVETESMSSLKTGVLLRETGEMVNLKAREGQIIEKATLSVATDLAMALSQQQVRASNLLVVK